MIIKPEYHLFVRKRSFDMLFVSVDSVCYMILVKNDGKTGRFELGNRPPLQWIYDKRDLAEIPIIG